MTPDRPKHDASTPDLDSLDAAWEEEEKLGAEGPEALPSEGNLDDLDDGWETVPDPDGGPPQRRRVSPKERARRKREKQRAKADLAAKKQKGKRRSLPGSRRDDALFATSPNADVDVDGRVSDASPASDEARPTRSQVVRAASGKKAAQREAAKRTRQIRTVVMIAAAAALTAAALYFMITRS